MAVALAAPRIGLLDRFLRRVSGSDGSGQWLAARRFSIELVAIVILLFLALDWVVERSLSLSDVAWTVGSGTVVLALGLPFAKRVYRREQALRSAVPDDSESNT